MTSFKKSNKGTDMNNYKKPMEIIKWAQKCRLPKQKKYLKVEEEMMRNTKAKNIEAFNRP